MPPAFSNPALLAASVDSNENVGLAIEAAGGRMACAGEPERQISANSDSAGTLILPPKLSIDCACGRWTGAKCASDFASNPLCLKLRRKLSSSLEFPSPPRIRDLRLSYSNSIIPVYFRSDEDSAGLCWSAGLREPVSRRIEKACCRLERRTMGGDSHARQPRHSRFVRAALCFLQQTQGAIQFSMRNQGKHPLRSGA